MNYNPSTRYLEWKRNLADKDYPGCILAMDSITAVSINLKAKSGTYL